ncbi:MAG: DUF4890 domain-containing protein [Bacteroidaceae bacterium]
MGLIMGLGVMAQDNKECKNGVCDSQKVRLTIDEKARIITDRMVKAYGLTAEQGEKLYVLNAQKLKQQCRGRKPAGRCGAVKQCDKKNECDNDCSKKQAQPGKQCEQQVGGPVKYRSGLKEILTPEQFKDFCTDRAIERQLFGDNKRPKAPRGRAHRPDMRGRGHSQCPDMRPPRCHNDGCCDCGNNRGCGDDKKCGKDKKDCKKDGEKGRDKQPKQKKNDKR